MNNQEKMSEKIDENVRFRSNNSIIEAGVDVPRGGNVPSQHVNKSGVAD